ncbi:MAG: sulfatase [Synoicihabitans sp.]
MTPDVVTLPEHFGRRGYDTFFYGKVFHHGDRDPQSWNRQKWAESLARGDKPGAKGGFAIPENQRSKADTLKEMLAKYGEVARLGLAMGAAYEAGDVPDNFYGDGFSAELATRALEELGQDREKPFFLALGFNKPHLNWVAPKRYWDLYERDEIPLARYPNAPQDGATVGLHPSFELRVRGGIPKLGPIPEDLQRTLMHAYLACVSYVDAQIGRVLATLEATGLAENTIVIVWSDHGYHLGDMGLWGKATNYELGTRVPLIVDMPDLPKASRGKQTDALVELIDMYPTLCDLAGIDTPTHVEGVSFGPVLADPERRWKEAAFSQFPSPALREWGAFPIRPAMRETYFGPLLAEVEDRIKKQMPEAWDRDMFENDLMGYSVRTERYRLTLWRNSTDQNSEPVFVELFDHQVDPEETQNLAARHLQLVQELSRRYTGKWRTGVQPPR